MEIPGRAAAKAKVPIVLPEQKDLMAIASVLQLRWSYFPRQHKLFAAVEETSERMFNV